MRILIFCLLTLALEGTPKLIAHRGASEAAPENTLTAFKEAWKEGADGIEGDFLLTSDKQIVCFHDKDTKRITGRKFEIAKTPWATLKELDVGSWKGQQFAGERMPLLTEALAILPDDKLFFIEIKCGPEIVPHLKPVLSEADPDRVFLISFSPDVVKACRRGLPDFQAHLVSSLKKLPEREGVRNQLAQLVEIEATGLQFSHKAKVEREFIENLRKRKQLTACWTVNDPKVATRVAGLGVDFITTDRPAALRKETQWPE